MEVGEEANNIAFDIISSSSAVRSQHSIGTLYGLVRRPLLVSQPDEQLEQVFGGVDQMQRVYAIVPVPTAIITKVLLIAMLWSLPS